MMTRYKRNQDLPHSASEPARVQNPPGERLHGLVIGGKALQRPSSAPSSERTLAAAVLHDQNEPFAPTMTGNLQVLLRLQELNLLRQGLALASAHGAEAEFDGLEERIERVRRQIPGPMLSQYDALSRRYLEPMAALSHNVCQACEGEIPPRVVAQLNQPNSSQCCPHCGRLLYEHERSPDYLSTK